MQSALQPQERRHKARFDALRRKIFAEMARSAVKWRLTWILPFNLMVLALLVFRGQAPWRVAVQGTALLITAGLFVIQLVRPHTKLNGISLFIGALCFFAALSVTGGLASPLLVSAMPLVLGASLGPSESRWAKPAFFIFFVAGFLALALLSRTALGELTPPLAAEGGWSTAEFVSVAMMSIGFVAVGAYRMGCTISRAYEQVALELAERREELCSENEDRTRELEGIAARLAHEVKNPLAAIKGLSTHMARNACDPKMAERLSIVAAEADRLQGIVDGFLSFSRGFDDLKVAPTKPFELARELVLLLETRAADNGVSLRVTGSDDLSVNADGRKLRQALLNLVLNAMQASPTGKTVTIDVGKTLCGDMARIKVSDEGPGMTSDILERIRKPYFTTKEGGSGLGVAVSRGLIEQHGGQLQFDSAPGRGTTVTIALPYCSKKFCALSALPNLARKTTEPQSELPAEAPAR